MKWVLVIIVFVVGMLGPLQAGMNAEFRRHATHALQAGTLNMVVGACAVIMVALLLGAGLPSWSSLTSAPWWALLGGLIGGSIVVTLLIAAPVLGAALLVAAFVLGQLFASVIVDHYGMVGYAIRPVSLVRIIGLVLLVAGVLLIEKG